MSFLKKIEILSKFGTKKNFGWFYLITEYWGDKKTDEAMKQSVNDPKKYPFKITAKLNSGRVIGFACVDHQGKNKCFVHDIDVDKKYRRKGVATAMYDFAEELTGKECIPSSSAYQDDETHLSNDAKKFWEKRYRTKHDDAEQKFFNRNQP